MILGLDISTSKIGLSVLNDKQDLLYCHVLKLDSKNSLEERCLILEHYIKNTLDIQYNIQKIY